VLATIFGSKPHESHLPLVVPTNSPLHMPAPTKPVSPLATEGDWADMSDDAEADEAPTVQVDSLDLTALSIDDKNKEKSSTSTGASPSVLERKAR